MSRICFFGCDAIAEHTLRGMFAKLPSLKKRVSLISPPWPKNRSPELVQFLTYNKDVEQLPVAYESLFNDKPSGLKEEWERLERRLYGKFDIAILSSTVYPLKQPPAQVMDRLFPSGMLLSYPALLPDYRGPCPIQHAILERAPQTGSTVLDVIPGVKSLEGPILLQAETKTNIDGSTRYSDLSVDLANLSGELLATVLENGEDSLTEYRESKVNQSLEQFTGTRITIDTSFAQIKFPELTASEVQARFNALDGSPDKPRAIFNFSQDLSMMDVPFLQKFDGQTVYFSGLYDVRGCASDESSLLLYMLSAYDGAPPGSLVWHARLDDKKIFVKCKDDTWCYFEDIVLHGIGQVNATELITRILKQQVSKPKFLRDGTHEFKFNFL